mmetsp:Transcript_12385/g.19049  ORF Transcript_12385/g.19049 Transcript_12385/m.19049 type:complete len:632 (-) Transcript_12385:273-2168(-)
MSPKINGDDITGQKRSHIIAALPSGQKNGAKKSKTKKKKKDPLVLEIRRQLQQCCACNDFQKAMKIYKKASEENIEVEAQSLYNLLNLCDGFDNRTVHIGTPKPNPYKTKGTHNYIDAVPESNDRYDFRLECAFQIQKDMERRGLALNESAFSALIRMLSKTLRLEEAESWLNKAEQTQQCQVKVRLYSSLLQAYCQQGDLDRAVKLWKRISVQQKLSLTEKEYKALLECCCCCKSNILQKSAPLIFEKVLSELAEDILVPCQDTVKIIQKWFQSRNAILSSQECYDNNHADVSISIPKLYKIDPPPGFYSSVIGPVVSINGWIMDSGCTIDESTGILTSGCLQGQSLQPVPLSEDAWSAMMDYNKQIVTDGSIDGHENISEFQGGGKGKRRPRDKEHNLKSWRRFLEFLESLQNDKAKVPHAVLDAANVGYYEQNFKGAPKHVNYHQIDRVVNHFVSQEKNILVILHSRHFPPSPLCPEWAIPIVTSWKPLVYEADKGMNDDWFWLQAALKFRCLLITNDLMRDHQFQMLDMKRKFERWKERNQVKFHFSSRSGLELTYPARYSRRIQRINDNGIVIPLVKQGDEKRFLDRTSIAGGNYGNTNLPKEETYLCIRSNEMIDKECHNAEREK